MAPGGGLPSIRLPEQVLELIQQAVHSADNSIIRFRGIEVHTGRFQQIVRQVALPTAKDFIEPLSRRLVTGSNFLNQRAGRCHREWPVERLKGSERKSYGHPFCRERVVDIHAAVTTVVLPQQLYVQL